MCFTSQDNSLYILYHSHKKTRTLLWNGACFIENGESFMFKGPVAMWFSRSQRSTAKMKTNQQCFWSQSRFIRDSTFLLPHFVERCNKECSHTRVKQARCRNNKCKKNPKQHAKKVPFVSAKPPASDRKATVVENKYTTKRNTPPFIGNVKKKTKKTISYTKK